MIVRAVKMAARFVMYLLVAVVLTLLAFGVAAVAFLGFTLAVQGWAANPPTTVQTPVHQ